MAYIGKDPADSFISFVKQDFSVSATTSYTLDNAVTNQNEIALFINHVRQEPTTAYTASGTSLTLTSATASGDDMYCVYLGIAKQTVNPPDGSVGSSQVAASIITGQTAETSIATDDTILIHDTSASALKKMTRANFVSGIGGTNTPAFLATQANTGFSAGAYSKIGYATEVLDTDNAYDNSTNYRFTPQTAGWYYIFARVAFDNDSASSRHVARILKNGSEVARGDIQLSGSYFANNNTSMQVDYIIQFNGSSDYVEVYGYTEQNGATKNTAGYGCFGGYKIIGA
jgi:hypothetical protein